MDYRYYGHSQPPMGVPRVVQQAPYQAPYQQAPYPAQPPPVHSLLHQQQQQRLEQIQQRLVFDQQAQHVAQQRQAAAQQQAQLRAQEQQRQQQAYEQQQSYRLHAQQQEYQRQQQMQQQQMQQQQLQQQQLQRQQLQQQQQEAHDRQVYLAAAADVARHTLTPNMARVASQLLHDADDDVVVKRLAARCLAKRMTFAKSVTWVASRENRPEADVRGHMETIGADAQRFRDAKRARDEEDEDLEEAMNGSMAELPEWTSTSIPPRAIDGTVAEYPRNSGKRWTDADELDALTAWYRTKSFTAAGRAVARTPWAVEARLAQLGVTGAREWDDISRQRDEREAAAEGKARTDLRSAAAAVKAEQPGPKKRRMEGGSESLLEEECDVCMAAPKTVAFVPCGHRSCKKCAPKLKRCPMCKVAIKSCLQLY